MLVCATLFWAGNFTIGKFAYLENISPFTLSFLRWSLVWVILIPFTYKEIMKLKNEIKKNLSLFFILGFTSVCVFTSFTYNALNYTQIINASLFNTAIPVTIIFVCFLLKIEKTNIFQISGLLISVLGILAIITKLDLYVLLSLDFNKGDLFMIGAIIAWGIYSAYLKKRTFDMSLLTLVHVICTFGLIFLLPLFVLDLVQGKTIEISSNFIYILIYIAIFPSIGSYYCWAGAVSIIGPNRAGIFLSLIPLFSTILAIIFFDEKFLFFHFIGSILIIL
jgi:drug/metabolite transporter (DMT)-like permease